MRSDWGTVSGVCPRVRVASRYEGLLLHHPLGGLTTECGVVLAGLVAVHLGARHAELGASPVLELHREADRTAGGQHLVALEEVVTHQFGDLVTPLPLGLDNLHLCLSGRSPVLLGVAHSVYNMVNNVVTRSVLVPCQVSLIFINHIRICSTGQTPQPR